MLEDLKPLLEARLHELSRLSSVYLKGVAWGPQCNVSWGTGTECE